HRPAADQGRRGLRHRGEPQPMALLRVGVLHGREEGRTDLHADDRGNHRPRAREVCCAVSRTMKAFATAVLALGIAAASAAVEVAGVHVPDTVTAEGKALKLNGAGLRKKLLFKVYVAALYLETPSKDGAAVVSSSEVKSMRLSILRSLKGSQVSEAISEGFERNSKDQMPKLQDRLKRLDQMIPDVKEGDEIAFTWSPDKG